MTKINFQHFILKNITITCKNANNLHGIFNLTSKSLAENETHFNEIEIKLNQTKNESETTLNDDSFADLTFDRFYGDGLTKIATKALGKTASTITTFYCRRCGIQNSSPNYDIWKMINQLSKLKLLSIGLDVSEIPSNAIAQTNQSLEYINFHDGFDSGKNVTIKSGALKSSNKLMSINFFNMNIKRIEREAFKLSNHSKFVDILFSSSNINGDSFESGAFDGIERPVYIAFQGVNMSYIPQSAFNKVLNHTQNFIVLKASFLQKSYIDCEDCRNEWLINQKKKEQVLNTLCKADPDKRLFDKEIVYRLKTKCKKTNHND